MTFTKKQHNLVKKQLQAHQRESEVRSIVLSEKTHTSLDLLIERGVFGSDIITTAIYLTRFLYENQELYFKKDVVDIGCGPGTQGILMSKYKAKSVVFADINPKAVSNTQKNIKQQSLVNVEVYESDLFNNFPRGRTYDVIVFNHPFFSEESEKFEGDPNQDEMLRKSMLGGTELLQRFFREVFKYLRQDGIIIMPYFHFAGKENNPATHAEKYGLKILQEHKVESRQGFHLGNISIYILSRDSTKFQ